MSKEILVVIILFVISFQFVYGFGIPIRIHEFSHWLSSYYFTGEKCKIRMQVADDNVFERTVYMQTVCRTSMQRVPGIITKLSGYFVEIVFATILVFSPLSIMGGLWFTRLARNFILFENNINSDLYQADPWFKLIIGSLFLVIYAMSIWMQYKWAKKLFK